MPADEELALFRSMAIAAGIPPHMTPNDIATVLHDWFESALQIPATPFGERSVTFSNMMAPPISTSVGRLPVEGCCYAK